MQATKKTRDACLPGETLGVTQNVDHAGVRAAGDDHQALATHVDDERLVVPDHRVGLPSGTVARLVDRQAGFELGHSLDLPGDEDGAVEQEALRALLDDLEPLGFEVVPAWRRQADFAARRKDDSAFAPGIGLSPAATASGRDGGQPFGPTVMIGVTVRDDDGTQVAHGHLEHVEVAGDGVRGEACVVQHSVPDSILLDADQRGNPCSATRCAAAPKSRA